MKKITSYKISIFIATLTLIMVGGNAFGADFYVDATLGNDSWNGLSPGSAWETIEKVNTTNFLAGDTIHFKCGETWREQLNVSSSGQEGNPITFKSYGDNCNNQNKPVINGSDELLPSQWNQAGNMYVADTNLLTVNNYIQDGSFDFGDYFWTITDGNKHWVESDEYIEVSTGLVPGMLSSDLFSPQKSKISYRNFLVHFIARAVETSVIGVQVRVENAQVVVIDEMINIDTGGWQSFSFKFHLGNYNSLNGARIKVYIPVDATIQFDDIAIKPVMNQLLASNQINGVENRYINLAQHPDDGYLVVDNSVTNRRDLIDNQIDMLSQNCQEDLNNAGIKIRTEPWRIEGKLVEAFQDNQFSWTTNTEFSVQENDEYYLYNKLCMLDSPGEWYYDESSDRLYIIMPQEMDSDPANSTIEISTRDFGIAVNSRNHIAIQDLQIRNAAVDGISFNYSNGFVISNVDILNSGHVGIAVNHVQDMRGIPTPNGIVESTNCIINTLDDTFANGIIEDSYITNSVNEGIHVTKFGNMCIRDNIIENSGAIGTPKDSRAAIFMNSAHKANISGNAVMNSGYNGIKFMRESKVDGNVIEDSCMVLEDCGAVYTTNVNECKNCSYDDVTSFDSLVTSNIVRWNVSADEKRSVMGIYLDNSSNGIFVSNNTVVGASLYGIDLNSAPDNIVESNILYGNGENQLFMREMDSQWSGAGFMQGNIIESNILFPIDATEPVKLFGDFNNIDFGVLDYNLYSAFYGKKLVQEKYKKYYPGSNTYYTYDYSLNEWQQKNQDNNSTAFSPFEMKAYSVTTIYADNYISNGTFETGISPWRGWSNSGNAAVSHEPGCNPGGGCLRFDTDQGSAKNRAYYYPVNLEPGKTYLLEYRVRTEQIPQNILVQLWQNSTWIRLDETVIEADTNWTMYETLIETDQFFDNLRIDFMLAYISETVFIDEVSLREVDVEYKKVEKTEYNDLDDDSHILVNNSSEYQEIYCPDELYYDNPVKCGEYIDLDGNTVSWPVTLAPLSSKIIVWELNPFIKCTDNDNDGFAVEGRKCGLIDPDDTNSFIEPISDLYAEQIRKRRVELDWTCEPTATGYNVYRSSSAEEPYEIITSNHQSDVCKYTDKRLKRGVTYSYLVRFINVDGEESPQSNESTVTLH